MTTQTSDYDTAKKWYAQWLMYECDNPEEEIGHLIDSLPSETANEFLEDFREQMEKAGKEIPFPLAGEQSFKQEEPK